MSETSVAAIFVCVVFGTVFLSATTMFIADKLERIATALERLVKQAKDGLR